LWPEQILPQHLNRAWLPTPRGERLVLSGHVVAADGEPIPKAEIHLGTATASTDAQGSFQLLALSGERKISISASGYTPFAVSVSISADTDLKFELQLSATSPGGISTRVRSNRTTSVLRGAVWWRARTVPLHPECGARDENGKRVGLHDERLDSAGRFGHVGWHTFRHTYRSWLDATGAPLGVQQKLMRHSQISTTMNVYVNALMDSKRDANSGVARLALGQGLTAQNAPPKVTVN
jgi:hypothetical protein